MEPRPTPFIPHTDEEIRRICEAIGVSSIEDLLLTVLPRGLRLDSPLNLPPALSEQELVSHMRALAAKNSTLDDYTSFLGAGAYNHYIPALVDQIISRSEFYTAYTPYQPELSQGTLQGIFEYQTLVCQLTGMEAANASLYDGASATAEACLMARRITRRKKILLSGALHPEYASTTATYLGADSAVISEALYCSEAGVTTAGSVEAALDSETACLVVQSPNFFGSIEDLSTLAELAHKNGALLVTVVTEPVSLGLLKPPGECGSDIVIGEGQSFATPPAFGGPYLGFMATRLRFVRQMPGRIVGETRDSSGSRSFCLTLATREQHIRRERATSNICTNEALSALAAAVTLAALGKKGFTNLAELNLSKAEYLKQRLHELSGVEAVFTAPTFNEFTIRLDRDPDAVLASLLESGIIGGLALRGYYPALKDCLLVTATEMNTRGEIDRYVERLGEVLKG